MTRKTEIAVYSRVSTKEQDQLMQMDIINEWLSKNRPEATPVYYEDEATGKNMSRPGLQMLIKDAYCKRFDTLIVYKLDRLSRSANQALRLVLDLDDQGCAFVSATQPVLNLGHENPFRRTMLAAFAEIAQIEREHIVERVRHGIAAAKKRGVKFGPPSTVTKAQRDEVNVLRVAGKSFRQISRDVGLSVSTVHKIYTESVFPYEFC